MSDPLASRPGLASGLSPRGAEPSANLADILERVLDKGVVIAGDIQINLLDIELLTIKLRLVVASVDKAKEMGIDWWERDPSLSSLAQRPAPSPAAPPVPDAPAVPVATTDGAAGAAGEAAGRELVEENARLRAELAQLRAGASAASGPAAPRDDHGERDERVGLDERRNLDERGEGSNR
ncbi:gas vesicle protein [Streptomyces sp. 71268]|uniref:gas vesicle protein n=1 Tax=Streptomyces sp. 71268 TaxID=3002640 RepID=UPI0023F7E9B7|nr:gas vesicle protein [Streptomyces sp. 71268]WEV23943.1 gas vesicle protein [Streptomyces sp. 71268]